MDIIKAEGQKPRSASPTVDGGDSHTQEEPAAVDAVVPVSTLSSPASNGDSGPEDVVADIMDLDSVTPLTLADQLTSAFRSTSPSLFPHPSSEPTADATIPVSDADPDADSDAGFDADTAAWDGIPLEELKVIRWGPDVIEHVVSPKAKAWLLRTASNDENGINAKIRSLPTYLEKLKSEHPRDFLNCPHAAVSRAAAFKLGQPIMNAALTIRTCVGPERPEKLYRAIHDKMPHDGIGARGLEVTNANGLFFQRYLQNHFSSNCRQPSPFLSTSSEIDRAVSYAASYQDKGFTGIKVLEIDTAGEYWDHHISRLWEVKRLLAWFGLRHKPYYKHEYLVENVIPKEHISRVYSWDVEKDREELDPRGRIQDAYWDQKNKQADMFERLAEDDAIRKREAERCGFDVVERKKYVPKTNRFKAVISHARKRGAIAISGAD